MNRDWESAFTAWSQGPSATEQQKCANAEAQIKEAIASSSKLRSREIKVFTQGSYRNRVNVRRDSDVDIGVLCYDTFFPDSLDDNVKARVNESLAPATYSYATFKNELEEALVARFGRTSVGRGPKAFDVKANTYRVEADVAAFFEHRRYTSISQYLSGVEMIPDDGSPPRIRNWPEQHYQNAVDKNDSTGRRFKRLVRVLKSLSNEMSSAGIASAQKAPSFLVECLVWNTPNSCLVGATYYGSVRATLAHLFNSTMRDELCAEWGEVSELKYLFRTSQPWSRSSAHQFVSNAWDYIGLV
jgi:hypothetical protein